MFTAYESIMIASYMSNLKLEFKFKLVLSILKFSSSNPSSDYDLG